MNNKISKLTLGLLALITTGIAFGQTQVPNTFQSGQPAVAAEVNDNFSALETAAIDNAAGIASNSTSIDGNATDIASNATAIDDNGVGIAANSAAIGSNTAEINTNTVTIQDNTDAISSIPLALVPMVQSNGQNIGAYLHTQVGGFLFSAAIFWVLSDTGYAFSITPIANTPTGTSTGIPGEIQRHLVGFVTADCTGQAYVIVTNDSGRKGLYGSGAVFASSDASDPTGVYYSPKGSTFISGIVTQSRIRETGCNAETATVGEDVIEVFPNDHLITGVPTQRHFAAPITLGY